MSESMWDVKVGEFRFEAMAICCYVSRAYLFIIFPRYEQRLMKFSSYCEKNRLLLYCAIKKAVSLYFLQNFLFIMNELWYLVYFYLCINITWRWSVFAVNISFPGSGQITFYCAESFFFIINAIFQYPTLENNGLLSSSILPYTYTKVSVRKLSQISQEFLGRCFEVFLLHWKHTIVACSTLWV